MASNRFAECYFAKGHVTRARREAEIACFGDVSSYAKRSARERGFVDDVDLCLGHSRLLLAENNRCAVVFDSDRCSGTLRPCAERLHAVLDDLSNSVSAYVCRRHRNDVDSLKRVVDHPLYEPPPKRLAVAPIQLTVQVFHPALCLESAAPHIASSCSPCLCSPARKEEKQ